MSIQVTINETKPLVFYKDEEIQPLFAHEVTRRQKSFGKNKIEKHSSRSTYEILINSIFDPFNILLIGISCLSLYLSDLNSFVIMVIMVFISSGIRFFQEQQSETKLNDLTSMVKKNITVIRRNSLFEYEEIVDLTDCVPGDFIRLVAVCIINPVDLESNHPIISFFFNSIQSDRVPADIQLLKANSLFVDQSILTGEPMPCLKYVKDPKEVTISYDFNNSDLYNLKKDKTFFEKFKDYGFGCLKDNFGIDMKEGKVKFDDNVLFQFDRNDLCFMGTSVISGNGLGIVLTIGKHTFFGIMSEQVSFHKPMTSFNKGMKMVSIVFIALMIIITVPIILVKGFGLFGRELENLTTSERWIYAAQFALSVAVGLTPEMLPMILNANLAKGTMSLSNKNCIVKRIEAITNLGSMNILCTDKTGTLTENFAQLCNIFDHKKQDFIIGLKLAYLNSANQDAFKNLTDQAIINAYEEKVKSIKDSKLSDILVNKIKEIPFDFSRRKVTVVYEIAEFSIRLLITKGAVNEMLDVCKYYFDQTEIEPEIAGEPAMAKLFRMLKKASHLTNGNSEKNDKDNLKLVEITPEKMVELHQFNDSLNQDGYRVLAVAYQIEHMDINSQTIPTNIDSLDLMVNQIEDQMNKTENQNDDEQSSKLQEKDLIFVSFLTFLNPPKKSAAKAIRDLITNNVKVKVLTGDTPEVCKNVCHLIGLSTNSIITSKQLNQLTTEDEMIDASIRTVIFSQLTPIQKFEIVKTLKKQSYVVGFLGDGINDVLALKEADVGISVDSGTEIAKDAADIILLEKELDVINLGVMCGRKSFLNTIKYISMAISGNFGNVISIFISCLFLPYLPMAPIHILLQNLLYDISQMTSPWDNVDQDVLKKPEVFRLRNLLIFMVFWGPVSSFFDLLTFAFLYFFYEIKTPKNNVALFQTGWFTVGILTQTLIFHIARTHKIPVIQSNASIKVYFSTIATLIFGLALPLTPLGRVHNMVQLPLSFYYFLFFILIMYCLTVQSLKRFYIILFRSWFTNL